MVEDTPQELVHDLVTETVFGDHPLGRPVLGSADVIANVTRRTVGATTGTATGADNVVVAAAGSLDHDHVVEVVERSAAKAADPPSRRPAAPPALRRRATAAPPLPAEGDRAIPRLRRRARDRALRPAALYRVDSRLGARRLGLVTALPGDPREAGARLLRVHVRVPVRGHRPDRRLRRDARGEPRGVPRDRRGPGRRGRRRTPAGRRSLSAPRRNPGRAASCSRWS